MTEMEQLKRNAEVEFAKQRMEEVTRYMAELSERCGETLYWSFRSDKLFFFAFPMYLINLFVCLKLGVSDDVRTISSELLSIIMWVTIFRSWWMYREFSIANAEFDGLINTLMKLGMLKIDEDGEARRRKVAKEPMFARIKTMLEKTFERESKEVAQPV